MTTVTELLDDRFYHAGVWYLEKSERSGDPLKVVEEKVAELFMKDLTGSVQQIPDEVLLKTKELAEKNPELFENVLVALIQQVGPNFLPANATMFVEHLNRYVQEKAVS